MPSPSRRSTRSGMPPSKPSQATSSSSSVSSARPERTTRAAKASPTPPDDKTAVDDANEEEEASSEVTRCVCGKQEYPGAPLPLQNDPAGDGDLFIQCDECNVWQHGGCVGIMDQNKTPDSYYCEKCDKDLHQLHTDDAGQRYSLFLPFHPNAAANERKSSTSRSNDARLKREREELMKVAADLGISKRRSTTNSRHTYDEEEMLRKAIEESKRDQDGGRKGKRGRGDSDDVKLDIKRRRTGSESIDAGSTLHTASLDADSDDDAPTSRSALKRARAQAAETQRQRELREREHVKEQQRVEAAGRRSQRAGRRRADESESEEPNARPTLKTESTAHSTRPKSPPEIEITQPSSSHKKGAGKKPKRTGRNQYTKDREASPARKKDSSSSGEEAVKPTDRNASTKQSPSSADMDPVPPQPSISHKAKGKHKGKAAATTNGISHEKKENGKPKFTSWEDCNAELTFLEDYAKEVIAHYEAKAAFPDPGRPPLTSYNSSQHLKDGLGGRKGTPLSFSHMSAPTSVPSDSGMNGGPVGGEDLSPANAQQRITPMSEMQDMPALETARAMLRDVQVARRAFELQRNGEVTPRPDAVRHAARDLGV